MDHTITKIVNGESASVEMPNARIGDTYTVLVAGKALALSGAEAEALHAALASALGLTD